MKISDETLNILKNFANINPGLIMRPGNIIKTHNATKGGARDVASGVFASTAEVSENFEVPFCLASIAKFLNLVDLFDDPDFDFGQTSVTISDTKKKEVNLRYGNEVLISAPPYDKEIKFPDVHASFIIEPEHFKIMHKAASGLEAPQISFQGDGKVLKMSTYNADRPSGDKFSVEVGETDKKFNAIMKLEHLKMIPNQYKISISSKKLAMFEGNPTYWIGLTAKSTFE